MKNNQSERPLAPRWLDTIYRYYWPLRQKIKPLASSGQAGMGAIAAMPTGATFRVWAPHADSVFVTGSFNGWAKWRTPMVREQNGTWSADVPQAQLGDEYKYIIHRDDHVYERTDPYARGVSTPFLNGVVKNGYHRQTAVAPRTTPTFQPPALEEMIIYELHVGTFAADGEEPPGQFAGVVAKLPYLQSLGINVIELMPVKEFPGDFSWGYNPSYPFAISQVYGGREALQALVVAAHAHGIAVIVDVVYNHFGPQDLSLWQFDGWQENGKGGIYFYNDWRSKTPWADTRPDYGRSEVRQYIRDNVIMWYEEFGVDGLRWDATSYIRNAHGHNDPGSDIPEGWKMMAGINAEVRHRFPHAIHIAEDLQTNDWLTKSIDAGGAGFHSQWDASFVHPVRQAIIAAADAERDMTAVKAALEFRYNANPFERVLYTESHDEVANGKARVPHEIDAANPDSWFVRKRSTLGAALVFTAPGVPMIFQGQEFLETGWFDDHVALDWPKAQQHAGIWQLYHDLIALRRSHEPNNTRGLQGAHINVFQVDNVQKWLAYHRWNWGGAGDDVIVVANFNHEPLKKATVAFPHPGKWRVRLNTDNGRYGADFGKTAVNNDVTTQPEPANGLPFSATMTVPPYTAVILSQDSAVKKS